MIEDGRMSYRPDTQYLMAQLLHADPDGWASLSGLMAVLALPPIRCADGMPRRREVEVEIAPGVWQVVESIAIEAQRIRFWCGANGTRAEFVFLRVENRVPRWRQAPQSTKVTW